MQIIFIVALATACYALFAFLRRGTRASRRNEAVALEEADKRITEIEREGGVVPGPGKDADGTKSLVSVSKADTPEWVLPSRQEAMIVPVGVPMETGYATFEGSLKEARAKIRMMPEAERAGIAIWTPGHIFSANQLLKEAPGHEHDRQN